MVELTLKWEKFGLSQGLHDMMVSQELVDVTVMCEGKFIQAHKSVLGACSTQFKQIFKSAPDKNPIIVLRGVKEKHFRNLLKFMYLGEATVSQDDVAEFIAVAKDLGVSALTKNTKKNDSLENPPIDPPKVAKIPPANDVGIQPPPPAPSRSASEHPILLKELLSENDKYVTAAYNMEFVEVQHRSIKKEREEVNEEEEEEGNNWSNIPIVADDLDASDVMNPIEPDIQLVQGFSGEAKRSDDPGPSTSEGGEPWSEEITATLRRTSRTTKRPHSPSYFTDDSENDEELLQSDSSISQGFEEFHGNSMATNQTHITTRNVIYKCTQCPTTFNNLTARVEHENTVHEIEGAFCELCNKVFKNCGSLRNHRMLYHTGPDVGRRHVCKKCGSVFSLRGDLKSHVRNSHGDLAIPHECDICHQKYKNKHTLQQHIYKFHKNKQ